MDAYFGYKLGALQYRSVRFETETLDTDNYQGNAVVNYTDAETPYTRIIEHKHFEFGTQPKTVISREYSAEWKPGDEPYYPVNDEKNGALYAEYKKLADAEPGVIFGGRLGEYKYYDMDKVIEAALDVVQRSWRKSLKKLRVRAGGPGEKSQLFAGMQSVDVTARLRNSRKCCILTIEIHRFPGEK